MASPASTSCPPSPHPLCVWGLDARGGRGRSGYSRCDCHFLHLDPVHYTAPFCTSILALHHAAPFCTSILTALPLILHLDPIHQAYGYIYAPIQTHHGMTVLGDSHRDPITPYHSHPHPPWGSRGIMERA
jgi:hypothetical protein